MAVRLIVSDIDGTLVGKSGRLSERTIRAFHECQNKGIHVVLASGRTFYGARQVALEAGIDCPIISANGGRGDLNTRGEEKPVFEDTIDLTVSLEIYKILRSAGCFMTSYVGKKIYLLSETNGYGSRCFQRSEAVGKKEAHVIADDEDRFLKEGVIAPYKYEAYSDDTELMEKLKTRFISMGLSVSSAFPYNLEIMSPGGGKARAIESVARVCGVALSDVMALGDGTNDLGMLLCAGYPVAMENAQEILKRNAKYIAPHVDADGAAIMIEKLALGEENE